MNARLLAVVLAGASCASSPPVKPEDMSVDAHRREAALDKHDAALERDRYDATATGKRSRPLSPGAETVRVPDLTTYNPTEWHLFEARRLDQHAREHLAAANALESSEIAACRGIPPVERAACPLLTPVLSRRDVDGGVRFTIAPDREIDVLVTRMRCHLAFARARGFPSEPVCPLYLRGVDIRRADGERAVEIVARDRATVDELRRLSRDLVRSRAAAAVPSRVP